MEVHENTVHKEVVYYLRPLFLKVPCRYCKKSLEVADVKKHEVDCPQKPKFCKFCQCDVMPNEYYRHIDQCGSRTRKCQMCDNSITLKGNLRSVDSFLDMDDHEQICFATLQENEFGSHPEQASNEKSQSKTDVNRNKSYKYSTTEAPNVHGPANLKRNALDDILKNKKVQEYAQRRSQTADSVETRFGKSKKDTQEELKYHTRGADRGEKRHYQMISDDDEKDEDFFEDEEEQPPVRKSKTVVFDRKNTKPEVLPGKKRLGTILVSFYKDKAKGSTKQSTEEQGLKEEYYVIFKC